MARGQIIVETSRLDETAKQVDQLANNYETEYNQLFGKVQDLSTKWTGEDNTAFTNQIEGFRDDFQRMTQLMRDYASYLRKVAASYRETRSNVASAAKILSQGN